MDVLATRVLSSVDDQSGSSELRLLVYHPFNVRPGLWKCGFATEPPITGAISYAAGVDCIHALVTALRLARVYLETLGRPCHASWRGMADCGLPAQSPDSAPPDSPNIPPPDLGRVNTDILATRWVGYADESAGERAVTLTVFKPFNAEGDVWRCGLAFGQADDSAVYYGTGADFIEALLDGLAIGRAVYTTKVTRDVQREGDYLDCDDLPFKVGRAFWLHGVVGLPSDGLRP